MRGFATFIIDVLNEAKRRCVTLVSFPMCNLVCRIICSVYAELLPSAIFFADYYAFLFHWRTCCRYYGLPLKSDSEESAENLSKKVVGSMEHSNINSLGPSELVSSRFIGLLIAFDCVSSETVRAVKIVRILCSFSEQLVLLLSSLIVLSCVTSFTEEGNRDYDEVADSFQNGKWRASGSTRLTFPLF